MIVIKNSQILKSKMKNSKCRNFFIDEYTVYTCMKRNILVKTEFITYLKSLKIKMTAMSNLFINS